MNMVLSVGCGTGSAGHPDPRKMRGLGHERLPLGQGGRAALLVGLAVDEVAFLVEVVGYGSMDLG